MTISLLSLSKSARMRMFGLGCDDKSPNESLKRKKMTQEKSTMQTLTVLMCAISRGKMAAIMNHQLVYLVSNIPIYRIYTSRYFIYIRVCGYAPHLLVLCSSSRCSSLLSLAVSRCNAVESQLMHFISVMVVVSSCD